MRNITIFLLSSLIVLFVFSHLRLKLSSPSRCILEWWHNQCMEPLLSLGKEVAIPRPFLIQYDPWNNNVPSFLPGHHPPLFPPPPPQQGRNDCNKFWKIKIRWLKGLNRSGKCCLFGLWCFRVFLFVASYHIWIKAFFLQSNMTASCDLKHWSWRLFNADLGAASPVWDSKRTKILESFVLTLYCSRSCPSRNFIISLTRQPRPKHNQYQYI